CSSDRKIAWWRRPPSSESSTQITYGSCMVMRKSPAASWLRICSKFCMWARASTRDGYPSDRWPICLPKPVSSPRSARCPAARSPATGTSPGGQGCRVARGWWRGSWPVATRIFPGTGSCAATVASLSPQTPRRTANSSAGCVPRAFAWTRDVCGCRPRRSRSMPSCGARRRNRAARAERFPVALQRRRIVRIWRCTAHEWDQDDRMFTNLPPITKALLIANGVVFVLQMLLGDAVFRPFALWPPGMAEPYAALGATFMPWQLLTYGFMHGGPGHLLFNMLALLMFGAQLELVWGQRRYL